MDWKQFFESYRLVAIETDADLLYQIGATVGGKPISAQQFAALLDDCRSSLQLRSSDALVDLCAGNGVITYELSGQVKCAIGVDFSQPYIENARKHKARPNLQYVVHDIAELENCDALTAFRAPSRILCYAALAYLTPAQVERMIEYAGAHGTADVRFFIGSILDKDRIWHFFNTWRRKLNYLLRVRLLRRDFGLGRWWSKSEIAEMAHRHGFSCEFPAQDAMLHTAHYRFDVLLRRRSQSAGAQHL